MNILNFVNVGDLRLIIPLIAGGCIGVILTFSYGCTPGVLKLRDITFFGIALMLFCFFIIGTFLSYSTEPNFASCLLKLLISIFVTFVGWKIGRKIVHRQFAWIRKDVKP